MIAMFDSGYGGLTVLKPIMEMMPEYQYLYLGDNARAPYGNRTNETLKEFADQAIQFLFDRGAVLVIFACNTMSGNALRYVQNKYLDGPDEKNHKILGVVIPAIKAAIAATKNNRIAVIGTSSTINSGSYQAEAKKLNPELEIFGKACPLLVPFIEEAWHHKPEAKSILRKYLRPLKSLNIDTLILGCTHYSFMKKDIQRIMGKKVTLIDPGPVTATSLEDYLARHPEIESKLSRKGKNTFLTTDKPEKFKSFVENNLGLQIHPQKVHIC